MARPSMAGDVVERGEKSEEFRARKLEPSCQSYLLHYCNYCKFMTFSLSFDHTYSPHRIQSIPRSIAQTEGVTKLKVPKALLEAR